MIHVGKHCSYDSPPNYPYFTGYKHSQASSKKNSQLSRKDNEGESASNSEKADPSVLSPGKRVQLCSQCIDQLSSWHSLKVTPNQFIVSHSPLISTSMWFHQYQHNVEVYRFNIWTSWTCDFDDHFQLAIHYTNLTFVRPSVRACVRAGGHGKPFDPY